jgi:glycerophosphoryl diester phosphodiesterase
MAPTKPIVQDRLIAHRGASAHAPENTLTAVRAAKKMGARWIETDVRLTSDRQLVMIHDDTLDRTTNGTGPVLKATLNDIKSLDAGAWFSPEFAGESVPTLEEFVDCILAEGLNLQLEIKEVFGLEEALVQKTCDFLKNTWPFNERGLFLSGFSERCMRLAARELPNVPRCLAVTVTPPDPALLLAETGCQIMHLQNDYIDDATLERLNQSGIEFAVATVNDQRRATELLYGGTQSVLTDDPLILQTNQIDIAV